MPFYNDFIIDPLTGCHNWTKSLSRDGYAKNFYGNITRQLWKQDRGYLADDLELDHLCSNRRCINLDHLEPVTRYENMRRSKVWEFHKSKTCCPKGHPYDEANTRIYKGRRHCRACDRLRRKKVTA